MATLRGEPVDRPAVSFYELDSLHGYPAGADSDAFFSDPSWQSLMAFVAERVDRIVMCGVAFSDAPTSPVEEATTRETWTDEAGSTFTRETVRTGRRTLTSLRRRDPDIFTVWTLEHLLKDADDLEAWLDLADALGSDPTRIGRPDPTGVLAVEEGLGDDGIAMIDTGDPLCAIAPLFQMGQYTIVAMTENKLMHRALELAARFLQPRIEAISEALPGRLWRIYGPEYATPPYLPPRLFEEYVTRYVTPMVDSIHRHGGYARIHSHGRIKEVLDHIVGTGCDGLDPIEPPPQGDTELSYVRQRYGDQLVLFGNLEASDIVNLSADQFAEKVARALREGTSGTGRGFVLLPSSMPYGRKLSVQASRNYRIIVEMTEALAST